VVVVLFPVSEIAIAFLKRSRRRSTWLGRTLGCDPHAWRRRHPRHADARLRVVGGGQAADDAGITRAIARGRDERLRDHAVIRARGAGSVRRPRVRTWMGRAACPASRRRRGEDATAARVSRAQARSRRPVALRERHVAAGTSQLILHVLVCSPASRTLALMSTQHFDIVSAIVSGHTVAMSIPSRSLPVAHPAPATGRAASRQARTDRTRCDAAASLRGRLTRTSFESRGSCLPSA